MGCTPCQQKAKARAEAEAALRGKTVVNSEGEQVISINIHNACGYSVSQLTKWREVLNCANDQNKLLQANITQSEFVNYVGIIDYTIEHISDDCRYGEVLNNILMAVHALVILGC